MDCGLSEYHASRVNPRNFDKRISDVSLFGREVQLDTIPSGIDNYGRGLQPNERRGDINRSATRVTNLCFDGTTCCWGNLLLSNTTVLIFITGPHEDLIIHGDDVEAVDLIVPARLPGIELHLLAVESSQGPIRPEPGALIGVRQQAQEGSRGVRAGGELGQKERGARPYRAIRL